MTVSSLRQRLPLVIGIVVLVATGLTLTAVTLTSRSPARDLHILFTGDTIGRLAACVCDGMFAGGLDYRRTCLDQRRAEGGEFLLVDVGGLTSGRQSSDILRLEELLRAMAHMGYHAANVGQEELVLGLDELRRLTALGVPLISLNVVGQDGQTVLPAMVTQHIGGRKVVVAGLVTPQALPGAGLHLDDPAAALARWLPTLDPQSSVVVLCDLPVATVRDLARDFPEVAVFLFRGGKDSHTLETCNRSAIMAVAGARYLGALTLDWSEQPGGRPTATGTAVLLDERYAPDALPPQAPPGIELSPPVLAFGLFRRGEVQRAELDITNRTGGSLRLGKVYSPCTCFAMQVGATEIADGATATITVTLQSLDLSGRQSFPLFIEVDGAVRGLVRVSATATVQEVPGAASPPTDSGTGP